MEFHIYSKNLIKNLTYDLEATMRTSKKIIDIIKFIYDKHDLKLLLRMFAKKK